MQRRKKTELPPPIVMAPPAVFFVVVVMGGAAAASTGGCRCTSGNRTCWPDPQTWRAFNISIDGQLLLLVSGEEKDLAPPSSSAHDPFWRADRPSTMQYSNLDPPCTSSSPCFSVHALRPSHVQSAVRFASLHNLRLSLKSTGHDIMGRSAPNPSSLSIWLHSLRSISFHSSSSESSCPSAASPSGAVTVGAGVQWRYLYRAAHSRRLVVVGAMSASVSSAGGYLQGGGHSPLSPLLGLAADNVLQLSVVVPDGRLLVVDPCHHPHLFWALRGGGGGTFGVVVSATLRTFPALAGVFGVDLRILSFDAVRFRQLVAEFARLQPNLAAAGPWAGYSYFSTFSNAAGSAGPPSPSPSSLSSPAATTAGFSLSFRYVLPNVSSMETAAAAAHFGALNGFLRRNSEEVIVANSNMRWYASFLEWHEEVLCSTNTGVCSDATGFNAALASRLLPEASLRSTEAEEVAAAVMQALAEPVVGEVVGHLVGGGAVRTGGGHLQGNNNNNSVNPAWRAAIWHVAMVGMWESPQDAAGTHQAMTRVNGVFRRLSPGSGAYLNEADVNEPEWQTSFFGAHYARLLSVKRAVDPHGILTCVNCVGSEFWSQDLTCPL